MQEMIKIDGSIGYGQVLRTAIALSAITLKPVKIYNIRIRRPKPGLRPQHLKGVIEAAKLVHAKLKGVKLGSTEIEFIPQRIDIPQRIFIDIGTAGSVTLLLQTLLPIIIFNHTKVSIKVIGGTDVKGAPTALYYKRIFFYYLEKLGIDSEFEILSHGFYPKGGGKISLKIDAENEIKGVRLTERGENISTRIYSIATEDLKKYMVAERQLRGFEENFEFPVASKSYAYVKSYSTGSSLFAETQFEKCKLGIDGLGEKGKKAEIVGKEVAENLTTSVLSGACLDKYMSDQIIPYIALAKGVSEITVEEKTEHFLTNIKTCELMLDVKFKIENNKVRVKGIGL